MVKVYTKGGDKGETSLYGGTRLKKSSPRVRTYGAIDTANASIGLARAGIGEELLNDLLKLCQLKLFTIAAEIASDNSGRAKLKSTITISDVELLEGFIDILNEDLEDRPYFMVPGSSVKSALLHQARVNVRAAERELVDLDTSEDINPHLIKFINRLSDLMFIMSRYVDEVLDRERLIHKSLGNLDLDMDLAKEIIEASLKKAREINVPMAVSVVDTSGNLIAFNKMDDTLVASIGISQDKAYTAATLRTPTETLSRTAKPGGEVYGMGTRDRMVIFGGGIPLYIGDRLVGAIGVSGGAVSEDISVANAGVEYLKSREV